MEPSEAIAFVRRYNAWRRGYQGIEQPQPYKIGQALDALCDHAERLERELAAERALADRLATWAQEHRNAYMGQVPHVDCGCGDCQILPVLDADLAAWKEARRE